MQVFGFMGGSFFTPKNLRKLMSHDFKSHFYFEVDHVIYNFSFKFCGMSTLSIVVTGDPLPFYW